jgi:large subunit ribosomal protein L10
MNRKQKEAVIASIKDEFSQSAASFLVGVKGLTVEEFENLRGQLRKEDGRLQVAKVRLMKRALQEVESVQQLEPFMQEQIGLVFAKKEVTSVAKVLCSFSKKAKALSVIVGTMDADLLDESAIKVMATLPSREVLLTQIARGLQAPTANFVNVLYQLIARLAFVLKAIEQKKQNNE